MALTGQELRQKECRADHLRVARPLDVEEPRSDRIVFKLPISNILS